MFFSPIYWLSFFCQTGPICRVPWVGERWMPCLCELALPPIYISHKILNCLDLQKLRGLCVRLCVCACVRVCVCACVCVCVCVWERIWVCTYYHYPHVILSGELDSIQVYVMVILNFFLELCLQILSSCGIGEAKRPDHPSAADSVMFPR